MKAIFKKFNFIFLALLIATFSGCEEDEDNLPEVVAGFTFTQNERTGTVTFINISEESNSYKWTFGDGSSSTEINPIRTFTTGTYTVSLEASNLAGATDTFESEISVTIPEDVMLPITFDGTNVDYTPSVFSGASFEVVDNPAPGGSNDQASKVGAITNSGAAFEGIFFDLGSPINFTSLKSIQMDLWSQTELSVLVKLEAGTSGPIEASVVHSGSGWEELVFIFDSAAEYSRFTIFIDGPGTSSGTFYIDNILQIETPVAESGCAGNEVAATSLPLDFEGCATFPASDNFGSGLTSTLAQNPDKTGINTSDFVLQIDKPSGSDFFAGIQNTFADNFDLTTTDTFKVKVYSTKANVVFRFELLANPNDGSIGNPAPVFVSIPNANEWTEVEILFSGLPAGPMAYNQLVIKPDNNQTDDPITNGGTYYLDDFSLEAAGGGSGTLVACDSGELVNDFETADDSIFDNFGGGVGTIIDNPDTSVNSSAKLGQYVKNAGEVFGGITIALDSNIDLNNGTFSIDVNSQSVRQLLFKLEGLNQELVIPTSGTGWETIEYDFTGNTGTVTGLTLIMDNGTQGDGSADWTIQFDNIRLCGNESSGGGGTGGVTALSSLPADFESGEEFSAVFESASVSGSITANTVSGGINTSANVYTFNKPAGTEFYGGMENVFASPLDLTTTRTFKVKVYSTKPNVVVQFELQRRPTDSGIPNYSLQQTVTNANEWVELTFDFGAVVPGSFDPNIYNAIVIIPDFDTGNNPTSTSETYYIDDLILE